jgi:hypothetical protein
MRLKALSKFVDGLTAGPTALELAQRELDEAKVNILKAYTSLEYAQAMVRYNSQRIDRLTDYIEINKGVS